MEARFQLAAPLALSQQRAVATACARRAADVRATLASQAIAATLAQLRISTIQAARIVMQPQRVLATAAARRQAHAPAQRVSQPLAATSALQVCSRVFVCCFVCSSFVLNRLFYLPVVHWL